MDIQKQNKEQPQIVDINETMNSLLSKVAEAVAKPEGATAKDLQEISNHLKSLKEVDKTTPYSLLTETKEKLQKAAQSLQMPESFEKETGEDLPTPDKTLKLSSEEAPKTEAEAKKKYNEIVNDNLDKTIKTIEEVISTTAEGKKSESEIQSIINQQAQKIANQILVGMLGRRLKNFTKLSFGEKEGEKEANEFELNREKIGKTPETTSSSEVKSLQDKQSKESSLLDSKKPEEGKPAFPDVGHEINNNPENKKNKQPQRVGQFPDFRSKNKESTPTPIEEAEKQIVDSPKATAGQEKQQQEVTQQPDFTEKNISITPSTTAEESKSAAITPSTTAEAEKRPQEIERESLSRPTKELNRTPSTTEEESKSVAITPDPSEASVKSTLEAVTPDEENTKSTPETPSTSEENTKSTLEAVTPDEENTKSTLEAPDPSAGNSKNTPSAPSTPARSDKTSILGEYPNNDQPDIILGDQIQIAGQRFNVENPNFNPNAPITEDNFPSLTLSDKFPTSNQNIGSAENQSVEKESFSGPPGDSVAPRVDITSNITSASTSFSVTNLEYDSDQPVSAENSPTTELSDKFPASNQSIGAPTPDSKNISNLNMVGQEDEKPPTADDWWSRIGSSSPNSVQQSNTFFGVDFGNAGGWIGDALSFFAISAADITRYANTIRRTINTEANAQAIMQGQTSGFFGFGGEGRGLSQLEQSRANPQLEDGEFTNRKGSYAEGDPLIAPNNAFALNTTWYRRQTEYESNDDSLEQIRGNKPNYGTSSEGDELANDDSFAFIKAEVFNELAKSFITPWSATGTPANKPKFSSNPNSDVEKWLSIRAGDGDAAEIAGYRNKPYKTPGTDDAYKANYRSRTTQIVGVPGTGFLKIYTKRALDFGGTQRNNENFVIPFQFEPDISGDSKSADYSQVSTLGRSQSAQVYRKSTERSITLTLNYLVTGPSLDSEYENNAQGINYRSKSVQGMELWTEEYVYSYVIRNLRNLVLPNMTSNTRHRLAPPIVQVWYGGINPSAASSTGYETDRDNSKGNEIYPTFRTNWHTSDGQQKTFRSLWVTKDVSVEYKAGKVNSNTRNNVWAVATIQLTEIAPSVVANEVFLWNSLTVS